MSESDVPTVGPIIATHIEIEIFEFVKNMGLHISGCFLVGSHFQKSDQKLSSVTYAGTNL